MVMMVVVRGGGEEEDGGDDVKILGLLWDQKNSDRMMRIKSKTVNFRRLVAASLEGLVTMGVIECR